MSTTSVCQTLLSLTQNFIHLSSCSETAVVRRSRQGMPVPAVVERLDVIGGVSNGRYSHFVASAMRLFVLEAIEETPLGHYPGRVLCWRSDLATWRVEFALFGGIDPVAQHLLDQTQLTGCYRLNVERLIILKCQKYRYFPLAVIRTKTGFCRPCCRQHRCAHRAFLLRSAHNKVPDHSLCRDVGSAPPVGRDEIFRKAWQALPAARRPLRSRSKSVQGLFHFCADG